MVLAQGQAGQGQGAVELKSIEVGNKICPVSGNKIPAPGEKGEMGEAVKYEYNGKIYNLCCPMCIKDFKKDPEKFSKIAEDEVKTHKEGHTTENENSAIEHEHEASHMHMEGNAHNGHDDQHKE